MDRGVRRYESGAPGDRPDQRLSREDPRRRAERERLHRRLLDEHMWQEANSCARKRRYVTFDQANAVARHREAAAGERLYIYHCGFCGGWHLTHQADQQRYGRAAGRTAEEARERMRREAEAAAPRVEPRFSPGDCVIDLATDTPCVVVAVGEQNGEPAYHLEGADGCSELGWVRESDVGEA